MQITRTSMFTGVERTFDIPVTESQLTKWKNGELIQNAMPHLSAADREFIKTGVTQEEWNTMLPTEDDLDDDLDLDDEPAF